MNFFQSRLFLYLNIRFFKLKQKEDFAQILKNKIYFKLNPKLFGAQNTVLYLE